MAALEALRFGAPVIDSFRDGNAGESVQHEVTDLLFDPCDSGALEAAMSRAIAEPETVRRMGQAASKLMQSHTPRTAGDQLAK